MPNTLAQYVTYGTSFSITNFVSGSVSLDGIHIQRVTIHLSSMIFDNKKENGTSIIDARVLLPTTIEVQVICSTLDAVEKINNILLDINSIYSISSKGLIFQNMQLNNDTILQSPDVLSAAPLKLNFQQRILQNNNNPTCVQTGDSTLVDNGINLLKTTASNVETFTTNLFNSAFS